MWPEVEQVSLNHRYELVLSGDKITKRLENDKELDRAIWGLVQLNFLDISGCPLIESLPDDIGKLVHLSTLTLTSNRLKELPHQIKHLVNIRHLNVSNNQLTQLDQDLFVNMTHLETLNLSNNLLESLPALSSEKNKRLAILNLSNNHLDTLPDISQLDSLAVVDLSSNRFQQFPESLLNLTALKTLHFDGNQLTVIPPQIGRLHKLKEIRFKANPLKDNRLKKLMDQDKIKAVLEYLAKQATEQDKSMQHSSTVAPHPEQSEPTQANELALNKIEILHFDQPGDRKGIQITMMPAVVNVRAHLLCCIVRDLDLKSQGNLKKFICLQNQLHDDLCQKRTLATIATHDLAALSNSLIYDARNPDEIALVPLGKGPKPVSAREFYEQLCRDAEHERKMKKRNQLSGLHKYLSLLENQQLFPCLLDQDRNVISLPPLTNSERTKLTGSTSSILIEISSSQSFGVCLRVMDSLLRQMIELDLGEKISTSNVRQVLRLQQTRVVDDKGHLKTTFPSRADLRWGDDSPLNIVIERPTT